MEAFFVTGKNSALILFFFLQNETIELNLIASNGAYAHGIIALYRI